MSNEFWNLTMVTSLAAAARPYPLAASSGVSWELPRHLLGVQPDIFDQMRALVTLILQMKTQRDQLRGW